jgi:hypothetical protein
VPPAIRRRCEAKFYVEEDGGQSATGRRADGAPLGAAFPHGSAAAPHRRRERTPLQGTSRRSCSCRLICAMRQQASLPKRFSGAPKETLGEARRLDGLVRVLPGFVCGFLQRLGFGLERRTVARDPGEFVSRYSGSFTCTSATASAPFALSVARYALAYGRSSMPGRMECP